MPLLLLRCLLILPAVFAASPCTGLSTQCSTSRWGGSSYTTGSYTSCCDGTGSCNSVSGCTCDYTCGQCRQFATTTATESVGWCGARGYANFNFAVVVGSTQYMHCCQPQYSLQYLANPEPAPIRDFVKNAGTFKLPGATSSNFVCLCGDNTSPRLQGTLSSWGTCSTSGLQTRSCSNNYCVADSAGGLSRGCCSGSVSNSAYYSWSNSLRLSPGETRLVYCETGFTGSASVSCIANSNKEIPGYLSDMVCRRVTCPYLVIENAGMFQNYEYGSKSVVCWDGYEIVGSPVSEVTCMQNGQWATPLPSCMRIQIPTEEKVEGDGLTTGLAVTGVLLGLGGAAGLFLAYRRFKAKKDADEIRFHGDATTEQAARAPDVSPSIQMQPQGEQMYRGEALAAPVVGIVPEPVIAPNQWYYMDQASQPQGPVSQDVLIGWLRNGQIPAHVPVCAVGQQCYAPAASIVELVPPVFNLPAPPTPTFAV